jgi:hypothetical protein
MPRSEFFRIATPYAPEGAIPTGWATALGDLENLESYEHQFRYDLRLFDFAQDNMLATDRRIGELEKTSSFSRSEWRDLTETSHMYYVWLKAATHHGIFAIYEFKRTVESLNASLKDIPGSSTPEIRARWGEANALTRRYFGRIASIRNAIGHSAEFRRPREAEKHAFTGGYEGPGLTIDPSASEILISGAISGRTCTITFRGEILTVDISDETLTRLREVKLAFYTIFGPLRPE